MVAVGQAAAPKVEAKKVEAPKVHAPPLVEQPLHRNVLWYRGGLVFEAHRLLYHSAQGSRTF